MSNQKSGCLEEMQHNLIFNTEEADFDILVDDYELPNIVDILYHDVDNTVVDMDLECGTVRFNNKDTFKGYFSPDMKKRIGTCHKNKNYSGTTGTWNSGLLDGMAVVENSYGGFEETYFKRGVKHGYSRNFGPQPKKKGNLWNVTLFKNGKMHGHFW